MAEQDNKGGGFGFEGLLRGIGDFLHQAANLSSDMRRSNGQRPQVESHMTVRSVDGEEIGADFFGLREFAAAASAPRDEAAPAAPDRREPAVEMIATAEAISAIVELAGADPESLTIRVEHDMLTIAASGCGIEYAAEALLPAPVDDAAREQSFRNGVLELKWPAIAVKAASPGI
jgi:HSP20 family molecular chaperone IbpA